MYNKTFNPSDEIDYKAASVAVKVLIDSDDNHSIRVIAIDENQEVPTHSVETNACAFVLEGNIDFMIGNENYSLNQGEMIMMAKKVPHSLFAKTKSKVMVIRL